jgi:hypothetical protein
MNMIRQKGRAPGRCHESRRPTRDGVSMRSGGGAASGIKKKGALSVAISYTNYSNATVRGIHGPWRFLCAITTTRLSSCRPAVLDRVEYMHGTETERERALELAERSRNISCYRQATEEQLLNRQAGWWLASRHRWDALNRITDGGDLFCVQDEVRLAVTGWSEIYQRTGQSIERDMLLDDRETPRSPQTTSTPACMWMNSSMAIKAANRMRRMYVRLTVNENEYGQDIRRSTLFSLFVLLQSKGNT